MSRAEVAGRGSPSDSLFVPSPAVGFNLVGSTALSNPYYSNIEIPHGT